MLREGATGTPQATGSRVPAFPRVRLVADTPLERRGTASWVKLADGRMLAYRSWAGSGEPLVLIHGLLDCSQGWDWLAHGTTRPCVAFDLPGFGGSDLPTRPRLSAYAKDISDAVALLKLDVFTLVGHSFGGGVACALAELVPEKVTSLVVLAPVGFGRILLSDALMLPGLRGIVRSAMPFALRNPFASEGIYMALIGNGRRPDPEQLRRLRARARSTAPGAQMASLAISTAGRSARAFHRRRINYDGPVVAVWGRDDRLVPCAHAPALLRALPQADVLIWDGMGHHPQRERSAQLLEAVERSARGTEAHGEQALAA